MMNLSKIVRNAGVAEVSEVQATGGHAVAPAGPTKEGGQRLAMIHISRIDAELAANIKAFREAIAPTSVIRNKAKVTQMKEALVQRFLDWTEETVSDREEIDAMPNGTTIPKFDLQGIRCTTAVIASRFGPVGTNEDAIVNRKVVKDELKRVTQVYAKAAKAVGN